MDELARLVSEGKAARWVLGIPEHRRPFLLRLLHGWENPWQPYYLALPQPVPGGYESYEGWFKRAQRSKAFMVSALFRHLMLELRDAWTRFWTQRRDRTKRFVAGTRGGMGVALGFLGALVFDELDRSGALRRRGRRLLRWSRPWQRRAWYA